MYVPIMCSLYLLVSPVLLQISQSGYAWIAPPSSSPRSTGGGQASPLRAGGTEGGRVANRGCFVKSAKLLDYILANGSVN